MSELDKAYEEFRFILEKLARGDCYALTGQGNINYEKSTRFRHEPRMQEEFLKKAMDKYMAVME